MTEQYIAWFDTLTVGDVPRVGGKNASLGEMIRTLTGKGVRVPEGFATIATAFREYVTANDTVVAASLLAVFFDLSRIAALGVVCYLIMDIIVHWGVFRHMRREVGAKGAVLLTAMLLDLIVLGAFLEMKGKADLMIIAISLGGVLFIFALEKLYLGPVRARLVNST